MVKSNMANKLTSTNLERFLSRLNFRLHVPQCREIYRSYILPNWQKWHILTHIILRKMITGKKSFQIQTQDKDTLCLI